MATKPKTKAEHKKVAEMLYKRLELAITALENATTITGEDKAEARLKAIEDKIAALPEAAKGKQEEKEEEEDELICNECGGDLFEVEKGVFYCEDCKLYFEEEK